MRTLLFIVLLTNFLFADLNKDIKNRYKELEAKTCVSNSVGSEKNSIKNTTLSPLGLGAVTDSKYPFRWVVWPGWYWNTRDSLASFYELTQNYYDESKYAATFSLLVYKTPVEPLTAAQSDIAFATQNSATIYENKVDESIFDKQTIKNRYSYTSGAVNWACVNWFFTHQNVTYQFQIFTTVSDCSANLGDYLWLQHFTLFPTVDIDKKDNRPAINNSFFKYYSSPGNGNIVFDLKADINHIFIYDINGKLIRELKNTNIWDGRDNSGAPVTTGFYISNINIKDKNYRLKLMKINQ